MPLWVHPRHPELQAAYRFQSVLAHTQGVIKYASLHAFAVLQATLHFCLATICMTTHIKVLKRVQCSAQFSMDDSSFIELHHLDKLHHQHLFTATKSHGNGAHSPVSELAAHLTELRLRGPSPATAPSPADALIQCEQSQIKCLLSAVSLSM